MCVVFDRLYFSRPIRPLSRKVFVTKRPLSPNVSCHQTVFVAKRPCHQTAFSTKRVLSPNGLRHQIVLVASGLRRNGLYMFLRKSGSRNVSFAQKCVRAFSSQKCVKRKSIEDLYEKLSNSLVFVKGLRKTAARTRSFWSDAVSAPRWQHSRPGGPCARETLYVPSQTWFKKRFLRKSVSEHFLRKSVSNEKVSRIYVKNCPTVLFLVRAFAKLQRERANFGPRQFRRRGGERLGQAGLVLARLYVFLRKSGSRNVSFAKVCQTKKYRGFM